MSTTGFNLDRGGVESSTGNGEVGTFGRGTFGRNIVLQKEGQKKQSSSFRYRCDTYQRLFDT
ncbi:unnamed protein product [Prunus armeniaca]